MPDVLSKILKTIVSENDMLRFANIYIAGIEVTQAVQYCNASEHLTDARDIRPDNAIQLVADKPAFVRVYVRTPLPPIAGVVGRVVVQRRRLGIWVNSVTLTQRFPPTITARDDLDYAIERGRLSSSLNFSIPAADMRGWMRLRVTVEVPDTDYRYTDAVEITANLVQTLRIRGIPVRYWGPDSSGNQVQLAAPTLADFQTTAAAALSMFPVSHVPEIGLAGIFTQNQPLTGAITVTDGDAECPRSWENLLFWLGVAKAIDGNRADVAYYALLPSGVPIGGAAGCGGTGTVAAGFDGDTQTMAHELGHVLGLDHAPCGLFTGDLGDRNYPAYEPYDSEASKMASIGEYGLDVDVPWVHRPSQSRDFMSYCGVPWISAYHYTKLLEHPLLNPRWLPLPLGELPPYKYKEPPHIPVPDPGWDRRRFQDIFPPPESLFVLTGVIEGDRIEMASSLRLTTRPVVGGSVIDGVFAELLNGEGAVIERAPALRLALRACRGCGGKCGGCSGRGSGLVQVCLPDRDDAVEVRLVRGESQIWSRRDTSSPPAISDLRAEVSGDELNVAWATDGAPADGLERALRWATGDGEEWQVLAVRLEQDEAVLPVSALPSGVVRIQAIVSDGFHTVVSDPVELNVPARPPSVAILWPAPDSTLPEGDQVRLWGIGTASDGRQLSGTDLEWELDGRLIGVGTEVWTDLTGCGCTYRLTLRAKDGGRSAEAHSTFNTLRTDMR